jgi:hypothetical protein
MQVAALEAIAWELAAIHQTLAGLNIIKARVEERAITSAPPALPISSGMRDDGFMGFQAPLKGG